MSAVRIGPYTLRNNLILAPMAGVTDQPFRTAVQAPGRGMVVSEMVTSDMSLWNSRKSSLRRIHEGDPEPRSVQIAGGDAQMMAAAARPTSKRVPRSSTSTWAARQKSLQQGRRFCFIER
jgi:tRNA-dihydrouridine synthase B